MNKALNKSKKHKVNKTQPHYFSNYIPPKEAMNPNQPSMESPSIHTGLKKSAMVDLYDLAA